MVDGPRMPKRTASIPSPEYDGFEVELWTNPPNRLRVDLISGDEPRAQKALVQIVLGTNGWCDADGDPLPEMIGADWIAALPQELLTALVVLISRETARIPNWITARNPNTASGSAPTTKQD